MDGFVRAYNQETQGSSLSRDGEALLLTYPACCCSCVKKAREQLCQTWCLCALGYAERLFDCALGCKTRAELLESVKTGGGKCVIRVSPRSG